MYNRALFMGPSELRVDFLISECFGTGVSPLYVVKCHTQGLVNYVNGTFLFFSFLRGFVHGYRISSIPT